MNEPAYKRYVKVLERRYKPGKKQIINSANRHINK
jgi:hypothetical protein